MEIKLRADRACVCLMIMMFCSVCFSAEEKTDTGPVVKKWTETDAQGRTVQYMSIDGVMVHETDPAKQSQPIVITPGRVSCGDTAGTAPSDAIVLFDGTEESMNHWTDERGNKTRWQYVDGALESRDRAGYIQTKETFGSCQLHIEWAAPKEVKGDGQGRGNSGIFMMGRYEIQVLDSFDNITYPDGQAGALYGRQKPLVNASRGPGEWQSFDIVFHQPKFDESGNVLRKATFTIFHNGVLIQDHYELSGGTDWLGPYAVSDYTKHEDRLPLKLQDHGNPVRFRNIWVRHLDDQSRP